MNLICCLQEKHFMKKKDDSLDLFYGSSYFLEEDWESILHSIITYSDKIWLNSNYKFSDQIESNKTSKFLSILNDLKEEGIVLTWQLESNLHNSDNSISRVITNDEHRNLYNEINQTIVNGCKGDFDIQSKFVEARHELFYLGLTRICEAHGITCNKLEASNLISRLCSQEYISYENILKKYSYHLFQEFSIGNLSKLSSSDIIKLRSSSKYYRNRVNACIQKKLLPLQKLDEEIINDCKNLYRECEDHLRECLVKNHEWRDTLKKSSNDLKLAVIGIFTPYPAFIPPIERVIRQFRKDPTKEGFLIYMMEAKKMTSG